MFLDIKIAGQQVSCIVYVVQCALPVTRNWSGTTLSFYEILHHRKCQNITTDMNFWKNLITWKISNQLSSDTLTQPICRSKSILPRPNPINISKLTVFLPEKKCNFLTSHYFPFAYIWGITIPSIIEEKIVEQWRTWF